MTRNLTEKRIAEILARAEVCDDSVLTDYADIASAMRELQERRKAEQDRDPLAYTDERNIGYINQGRDTAHLWGEQNSEPADVALYRHAQPARVETEDLYKLANHIASSKSGLPDEWLDWAKELETDIRRAAVLQVGNSLVIPDSIRDALLKSLAAMEFMGDTLNNLDAVCTEDVGFVAPAFDAVRSVLAAAQQEVK
ncbi:MULTISPECIES: hypothetical protein [Raoultella]|jgi:hypothetical protein|uniref:Ead/Ea22-like family protein n=3 Tax=Raoultella TaxID=160674 RepID=A0ABD7QMN5_RAOOR|nr:MULTISPECIES: hypothetical protein [Raoultella]TCQ76246.1 hypothetical protein EC841_10155 [Raoultella ornithinolytica]MCS4271182.1 hypothetical protein [Raoultella sp. BIGb0132]MCS4288509.1 hypothetical protein [Raoultella terrigena]VED49502.1 Uncharacterised protein [Raoultella terrigena]VTM11736.1 Uncharacterised protein [Raoultella terrigena]